MYKEEETLATDSVQHWTFKSISFRNRPVSSSYRQSYKELLAHEIIPALPLDIQALLTTKAWLQLTTELPTCMPLLLLCLTHNLTMKCSIRIIRNFQQLLSYITAFYPHSHSWDELFQQRDYTVSENEFIQVIESHVFPIHACKSGVARYLVAKFWLVKERWN